MNSIWQEMTQTLGTSVGVSTYGILAQAQNAPAPPPVAAPRFDAISGEASGFFQTMWLFIPNLIGAIAILVLGWLIAAITAALVRGLLNRTSIDNRIADWITGRPDSAEAPEVEKWVSSAVYWLILIFTLVAFLQALNLTAVSAPLNNLLNQVLAFLPRLAGAAILLGVAWVLASLVKLLVTRGLRAFQLDRRLGQQVGDSPSSQFSLSETIGNTLYWLVFLFFLPAVLNALELQGTLQPVQRLLDEILSILPNIFAAILIGVVGWFIAQIVRRIVTNLLAATGADRLGARFGLSTATGQSLSGIIGTIVYVFILIPTAIAALNALGIAAISAPAIAMLDQILNAIPRIFTAGLILALAYLIGRFVADFVTNILTSIGFNNIFNWLGLSSVRPTVRRQPEDAFSEVPETPTVTRTPSEIVGIVALVGIILLAIVPATEVLAFPGLTVIVTAILAISGQILAGLVVFAIGLFLANFAYNLIVGSGTYQAKILANTARIAIIALVSAMALQQMGVASDIVNLAFGLLLGAIAVAIALAFGLGGREIAADQVREWLASFKDKKDKPM
jgi:Conserved TM helix